MGHYILNTGNEPVRFLEMFSDRFADISLNQWLALTPSELVQAHLNLDDATTTGRYRRVLIVNQSSSITQNRIIWRAHEHPVRRGATTSEDVGHERVEARTGHASPAAWV